MIQTLTVQLQQLLLTSQLLRGTALVYCFKWWQNLLFYDASPQPNSMAPHSVVISLISVSSCLVLMPHHLPRTQMGLPSLSNILGCTNNHEDTEY